MPTNSPDKTRLTTRTLGAFLAVAALLAVGVHRAEASLLVYEGFDHAAGAGIHDLNGGSGFVGGWENWLGFQDGTINAGSLPSSAGSTTGNSASLSYSFLRRPIEEISGAVGTETWASVLFSLSVSTVDPSSTLGHFVLSPVDSMDSCIWAGVYFDGSELVFGLGGNFDQPIALSSISPVAGETYRLTVSIEWNAGDTPETIRLFLNPPAGAAPDPSTAIATVTDINLAPPGSGLPNRIVEIATVGVVPEGAVVFDEIRIGGSFADIVPVPEPSTASFVAIALGVFARFRVRRA